MQAVWFWAREKGLTLWAIIFQNFFHAGFLLPRAVSDTPPKSMNDTKKKCPKTYRLALLSGLVEYRAEPLPLLGWIGAALHRCSRCGCLRCSTCPAACRALAWRYPVVFHNRALTEPQICVQWYDLVVLWPLLNRVVAVYGVALNDG